MMKVPCPTDAERCIELRKRSKRGGGLLPSELAFCGRMLNDFPEWYKATDAHVFNETVPFGSNAHMPEDEDAEGTVG